MSIYVSNNSHSTIADVEKSKYYEFKEAFEKARSLGDELTFEQIEKISTSDEITNYLKKSLEKKLKLNLEKELYIYKHENKDITSVDIEKIYQKYGFEKED